MSANVKGCSPDNGPVKNCWQRRPGCPIRGPSGTPADRLPAVKGEVLGIVYRVIAGHLVKKAGETQERARTGAVTLIQRFGSALNLNEHA